MNGPLSRGVKFGRKPTVADLQIDGYLMWPPNDVPTSVRCCPHLSRIQHYFRGGSRISEKGVGVPDIS